MLLFEAADNLYINYVYVLSERGREQGMPFDWARGWGHVVYVEVDTHSLTALSTYSTSTTSGEYPDKPW